MKAIVTLPDHGLSNSKARSSRMWIKQLDSVDANYSDGYAFRGDFTTFDATVEVPVGTWFLSYVEDRSASRLRGRDVTLYRVTADGLDTVDTWRLDGRPGWALQVRDAIAGHLTAAAPAGEPGADRAALLTERAALLARLDEIDAQLA